MQSALIYAKTDFEVRQTTSRRRYRRAFDLTAMILRKDRFWCPRNRPSFGGIGNLFANFSNDLWRKVIRLKLLACQRLSRPVFPRKPSRWRMTVVAEVGHVFKANEATTRPKRKAPARGPGLPTLGWNATFTLTLHAIRFKRF